MRSAVAATALGMTLVLAGLASCAGPDDPLQPPGPDPSRTPVFASDEEALAAAEEVYGRYVAVINDLGRSGWVKTDKLPDVLRDRALESELSTAEEFSSKGYRQIGETSFDSMTLQSLRDDGRGSFAITVYLCLDVSDVDVIDAEDLSVVSDSRPERQPLEVAIDNEEGDLKVSRSEAWPGASFC